MKAIWRAALAALLLLAAPSIGAAEMATSTLSRLAVEADVAVSQCYSRCFERMAHVDQGPIRREGDSGHYALPAWHSSQGGIVRCRLAIRSQYLIEQCGNGCTDIENAHGWRGRSVVRDRYRSAREARRDWLELRGLLPVPPDFAAFDQACRNARDGFVFFALDALTWTSDDAFKAMPPDTDSFLPDSVGVADD